MLPTRTATLTLGFRAEDFPEQALLTTNRSEFLARAAAFIEALSASRVIASVACIVDGGDGVAASGTVTLAGAAGTVGATINGVSVTTAFATSDTVTAAALAAAINNSANALVNQHVTATSALGVVTITHKLKSAAGNADTLAATGTGATASGARLTGGVTATDNTVIV